MIVHSCANVEVRYVTNPSAKTCYYYCVFLIEENHRIIVCEDVEDLINICSASNPSFQKYFQCHDVSRMMQIMAETITEGMEETCNETLSLYIKESVHEHAIPGIHYTVHDKSSQVDIFSFD